MQSRVFRGTFDLWVGLCLLAVVGCSQDSQHSQTVAPGTSAASPAVGSEGAAKPLPEAPEADIKPGEKECTASIPPDTSPEDARVPDTLCSDGSCVSKLPPSDICVWGAQADAIVVARVTSFHAVDRGAMRPGKDAWVQAEDCKAANSALAIGLSVERALSGEVECNIVLNVGFHQVDRFCPGPSPRKDGTISWFPTKMVGRGPLRIGQRILAGIHLFPGGWSLKGDTILGIDADGRVSAVPRTGDCLSTQPVDIDGLDIDAVAAKLACTPDPVEVETRRQARDMSWGHGPGTHAAVCLDAAPGSETGGLGERDEDAGGYEIPLP